MKDVQTIREFVAEVCWHYSICLPAFIKDYDEDDPREPVEYFFKRNRVDWGTLKQLSNILGMRAEDIAEADFHAALKLYNKYPFFRLLGLFEKDRAINNKFNWEEDSTFAEKRLLYAVFGEEKLSKKYSEEDLLNRLNKHLLECDAYIPGTFHPEAEIAFFTHIEYTIFDFPQYYELMRSFFDVYDRMSFLFFKAIHEPLTQDEINEYNLFVSYFRAQDWPTNDYLHYDLLRKYRDILKSEGYHDIDSYLRINKFATDFEPWHCKQFAEDAEFAQRYQDIYPSTKNSILEFCMQIKNICCFYFWSDDPYVEDEVLAEVYPDRDNRYHEWLKAYIPKTERELGTDEECAGRLSRFASPASKGGLIKRKTEISIGDSELQMKRRFDRFAWREN